MKISAAAAKKINAANKKKTTTNKGGSKMTTAQMIKAQQEQIAALTEMVRNINGGEKKESAMIGSVYNKTSKAGHDYQHVTMRAEEVADLLENHTYKDKHGTLRVAVNIKQFGAKQRVFPCTGMSDYEG